MYFYFYAQFKCGFAVWLDLIFMYLCFCSITVLENGVSAACLCTCVVYSRGSVACMYSDRNVKQPPFRPVMLAEWMHVSLRLEMCYHVKLCEDMWW